MTFLAPEVINLLASSFFTNWPTDFDSKTDVPTSLPHDGASVLACAYQLKVRSQNPKDFEHGFSQRLWVKFAIFLLNSTSVDACAIYGGAQNINFIWLRFLLFSLTTLVCLFLDRYKHASGNACYLGGIRIC